MTWLQNQFPTAKRCLPVMSVSPVQNSNSEIFRFCQKNLQSCTCVYSMQRCIFYGTCLLKEEGKNDITQRCLRSPVLQNTTKSLQQALFLALSFVTLVNRVLFWSGSRVKPNIPVSLYICACHQLTSQHLTLFAFSHLCLPQPDAWTNWF